MGETRFVMFCGQRTGSTNIWLLLQKITNSPIVHEPFHPERFHVNHDNVSDKIGEIFQGCFAFKHIHEHLPRQANILLLDHLRTSGIPLLFLRRRDFLARAISRELALRTNHWMKYPERQSEYLDLVRKSPLSVERIGQRIENDRRDESDYSEAMVGMQAMDVFYEDIYAAQGSSMRSQIERLCSHIGVSADKVLDGDMSEYLGAQRQQNPPDVYHLVPNWDEIREHFSIT